MYSLSPFVEGALDRELEGSPRRGWQAVASEGMLEGGGVASAACSAGEERSR